MYFESREQKNAGNRLLEASMPQSVPPCPGDAYCAHTLPEHAAWEVRDLAFIQQLRGYEEPRIAENALQDVLDASDALDVDGEHALWIAVLQRTLRDAEAPSPVRNVHEGQSRVTRADQADARACLADMTWCEDMCERAGIDVRYFQEQIGGRSATNR